MKKLLALLLTVAMVLSLAACGPNTDQTTQAPAQTTQAPDQTKAPDQPTQAPDQPTQAPDQPTTAPEPEGKIVIDTGYAFYNQLVFCLFRLKKNVVIVAVYLSTNNIKYLKGLILF